MTKRKTPGTHPPDHGKAESPRHERRTNDRRADDRRAHARFSPQDARTDRRQGDRRGTNH